MMLSPRVDSSQLHQLRHQVVRDLAWCCLSPPLLQALPGSNTQILSVSDADIWHWLLSLDQAPDELIADVAQCKSTRLGIYYECLWRFYFTHSPHWQLLAQNLPIYRDKTTLGAFDFLCRRGDDYWHIETAVKFYLCNTSDPQQAKHWQHWIGPNNNDRLDLKLTRLRDHQLPLHQTPEGRNLLQAQFPDAKHWNSGLCLQGYLFSPAPQNICFTSLQRDNFSQALLSPHNSDEFHGAGLWWYLRDFLTCITNSEETKNDIDWVILQRTQWFSPVQSTSATLNLEGESRVNQLIVQLQHTKRPLMIAVLKRHSSQEKNNVWIELRRGFVVPDNWPEHQ